LRRCLTHRGFVLQDLPLGERAPHLLPPADCLDQAERVVGGTVAKHGPGVGAGHPDRARQDRRQHCAHILCRAHCLPDLAQQLQFLDRTHQFGRALAQFFEQSRILDRDNSLRREIFQKSDFFFGGVAYLMASQ
jgi:hypothetical protein